MSKDCKRSYEEVHKKLGEELEKAYLKRETPEEKIPEFDLSFLEEQPYEPTEENDAAREESFILSYLPSTTMASFTRIMPAPSGRPAAAWR